MTGPDDPYLAAAEACAIAGEDAAAAAGNTDRRFVVPRDERVRELHKSAALRAAVDAVRRPLLDANQQLTNRIAELEAQRERRPSNPAIGEVGFRVEAWPHDPGANGEEYFSGCVPAAELARDLRQLASRVVDDWTEPECPWPNEHGGGHDNPS